MDLEENPFVQCDCTDDDLRTMVLNSKTKALYHILLHHSHLVTKNNLASVYTYVIDCLLARISTTSDAGRSCFRPLRHFIRRRDISSLIWHIQHYISGQVYTPEEVKLVRNFLLQNISFRQCWNILYYLNEHEE